MSEAPRRAEPPSNLNVEGLIRGLERLTGGDDRPGQDNRAALAGLRRGLGKEDAPPAALLREVVPLLPAGNVTQRGRAVAFLVAPLFALHPLSWGDDQRGRWERNFGASVRRLAQETESAGPERRFMALLDADADDLGPHLRYLVALLAGADRPIPVDWRQLTWDLLRWERADREVQRRWADAFWAARAEAAGEAADEDETQ